jgi:hypothetical protein
MKTIEFETAKKLDELGVKKNAYFVWFIDNYNWENEQTLGIIDIYNEAIFDMDLNPDTIVPRTEIKGYYPAYTLDEILEMLPRRIKDNYGYCFLIIGKIDDQGIGLSYSRIPVADGHIIEFRGKNPAEAAAQLLIWCIENNYITKEEINNEISTKN